ncbi:MAG TPA: glycoside hydrolase family 88 protein [Steroidobacteraceae bacterium]|nr:glycoside hydrolase family 88 protein [Steroidobacteraceae bacterium]
MRAVRAAARLAILVGLALGGSALAAQAPQPLDIGLGTGDVLIEGSELAARSSAAPTVLLLGGLRGPDASVAVVRGALEAYARVPQDRRDLRIIAIPLANPAAAHLEFPPQGTAYRDHPESQALWRWIGVHAPDLVLIAGRDDVGLARALSHGAVAEVGRIPARAHFAPGDLLRLRAGQIESSQAHREMDRRRARSPLGLARELARYYGHDFALPIYINAIALEGQLRLGHLREVEQLVEPYVDGSRDSLARPNSLVFAGHIIFGELARRTHDPRYLARLQAAAAYGFDADGHPKEAMPFSGGFSDSLFMGTVILAQAGALTGERRYFDMAARHIAYMQRLDLRPDGLYRHHPGTDVAWGRGNAFAALGLALTLADFPPLHPDDERLVGAYRSLMAKLLAFQDADGMWRNVIDFRGSYSEYSATAMIAFAMLKGVEHGWLPRDPYSAAVQRAWQAVLMRTGSDGRLIDVCESTAQARTLEDYLHRAAILGADPRGGAMALNLATELAGLR